MKVIVGFVGFLLFLGVAEAKESGSQDLNCPKGSFVKGVVAHGAKAMSLLSGGLNDAFSIGSNRCMASHGWTIALSDVSLICYNPVQHSTMNFDSTDGSENIVTAVDLDIFSDSSWFHNTTSARQETKRDMSVSCSPGEMVEFNTSVSLMDPFCQGSVEVATKPFRCVNYDSENPTTGFKMLKSTDSALAFFKLKDDLLSSKVVKTEDLEYLSFALPVSSSSLHSLELNSQEVSASVSHLVEEFNIPLALQQNQQTQKLLALYLNFCHENRKGKEGFVKRDKNSSLLNIPGRKCWYPEDQVFGSKLNEVTREIEAILEAGFGVNRFVETIDDDMRTPSMNFVNPTEALFEKLGTNGGTAEQFSEAMNYYNSSEFAEKVQVILQRREHSYLEWAFRLKLYKRIGEQPDVRFDLKKILEFSKKKMIKPIMDDKSSKMDINQDLVRLMKELEIYP